jgi:hypothetical protein
MNITSNVSVPRSYFVKTAQRDYSSPLRALIREFLQNSRDAGATDIHFNFIPDENNNIVLTVEDNGCGMDQDIIVNKLMALGETTKEGSDHTGGFGVAKILLFFAHESYTIETRNLIVKGSGGVYNIQSIDTYRKGVKCSVLLAKEVLEGYYTARDVAYLAKTEIQKSYLPNLNIFVQSEKIEADFKKGRIVDQVEEGITVHKKSTDCTFHYALVRVKGLHMFDLYVGETKAQIVVELSGYSTKYLTTSRDSLRGDYRDKIARLCQEFVLNSSKGKQSTVQLFEGKFNRVSQSDLGDALECINAQINYDENESIESKLNKLNEVFDKVKQTVDEELQKSLDQAQQKAVSRISCETWIPLTVKDVELEHHYFVETRNGKKLPVKWEPQNLKPSQVMVLELWSTILSKVLNIAGFAGKDFNVGYVLDETDTEDCALANFRKQANGNFLFLLNPLVYGKEKRLPIKRSRRTELILWLLNLATHEVTHANDYNYHNESFIVADNELKRKCFEQIKDFLKL